MAEIILQLVQLFDQFLADFTGLFDLLHERCDLRRLCQILQLLVNLEVLHLQVLANLMQHLHVLCHFLFGQQTDLKGQVAPLFLTSGLQILIHQHKGGQEDKFNTDD